MLSGNDSRDGYELLSRIISRISSSKMFWNQVIINLFTYFNPDQVIEISPTNILTDLSQSVLRKHNPKKFKTCTFDYFNDDKYSKYSSQ